MNTTHIPLLRNARRSASLFAMLMAAGNLMADSTFNVTNTTTLNTAIAAANAATAGNTVTINLTGDITLTANLTSIALASGVNLVINGGPGIDLNGANAFHGITVLSGNVKVNNLTIANTVAQGGNGGNGAGGGAGLGGAIVVGSTANVTLSGVNFSNNSAKGGAGGSGGLGQVLGGGGGGGASLGGSVNGVNGSTLLLGGSGGNGGGINIGLGLLTNGANGGVGGGGGGGGLGLLVLGGNGGDGGFGAGGGGGGGVGTDILGILPSGSGGDGGFGGGAGAAGLTLLGGVLGSGGTAGFGGGTSSSPNSLLSLGGNGGGGAGLGGNVFVMQGGSITIAGSSTEGAGTVTGGAGGGTGATAGQGIGTGAFLQGSGTITYGAVTDLASDTILASGGIADEAGNGGLAANKWTLAKNGAGKLILAGDNTYSGGTTINGGVLQIGNGGATGSLTGNVTNNAVLAFNRTGTVTYAGVISGTGALHQDGPGVLQLTGVNTYTGATQINAGTLQTGVANALSTSTAVSVASGATLAVGNFNQSVGSIAGAGNITLGTGTLTTGADNTSTLFSGVISGAGGLTKNGTGTLTLSGANTYTGATTVSAGTLQVDGTLNGTSALTIASGATLAVSASGSVTGAAGTTNVTGGGTGGDGVDVVVTGTLSNTGTVTGGTGGSGGVGISGNGGDGGSVVLAAGGVFGGTGNINGGAGGASGSAGGNGGDGGAGVTSSVSNTLTNSAHITGGNGGASTGGTAGDGGDGVNFAAGGTVTNNAGGILAGGTGNNGGDGVEFGATGTVTNNAGATITAGTGSPGAAGNGVLFTAGNATVTNAGTINGGVKLASGGTNAVTLVAGGVVNGDLDIGANTASTLTLTGGTGTLQTYSTAVTGTTTFAGTLVKSGDGTWILDAATGATALNVTGGSLSGNASTITGDATLAAGTSLIFNQTVAGTYAGDASGAGSLVKNGPGDLTLTGTNSYTGGTALNEGALIGDTGSLQGTVTTASGTTVVFNQTTNGTFAGSVNGSGAVVKNGSGEVTFGSASTYTGGTTINDGAIVVTNGQALGTGTVDVNGPTATLTANTAVTGLGTLILRDNATWDGSGSLAATLFDVRFGTASVALVGTGSVQKTTADTVTFSGNNTYSGGTVITEGTLIADSAQALGTGAVDVNGATATLTANAAVAGPSSLILRNNATWDGTGSLAATLFDVRFGTASVILAGTGALTKTTADIVTLSGVNTFTGGSTISAGVLVADSTQALGTGNVDVNGATLTANAAVAGINNLILQNNGLWDGSGSLAAATFDVRDGTASTVLAGTGSLAKTTAGTVTLSGANTYTGGSTISAGTVVATNATALGAGPVDVNGGTLTANAAVTGITTLILQNDGRWNGSGSLSADLFDVRFGIATTALVGTGNLVKSTSDTVVLSGTNTYGGTTTINGGTLRITNVLSVPGAVTIASGATLAVNAAADATFANAMGGAGNFTKEGTNTLTITGANTLSGVISATAGKLVIADSAESADAAYSTASGATIEWASAGGTLSANLAGAGDYRLSGSGVTTLSGNKTGTGDIIVGNSQTLDLGGSTLAGGIIIEAGGTLKGTGSFVRLTNNGTFSPGNSPGTVTLAGNFVNAGTLDIEIQSTAPGQFDLIQYAGSAIIAPGSTLNIIHLAGYIPAAGDSVHFLEDTNTASQPAVVGDFTTKNLPVLPAGLSSAIITTNAGMYYTVFNSTLSGSSGFRPHDGLEYYATILPGNAAGYAPLAALGVVNGNAALTQSVTNGSPLGFSAIDALVTDENRSTAKFVADRARASLNTPSDAGGPITAFADVHGAVSTWDEDLYTGGTFDQNFFGGKVGLAADMGPGTSVGIALGYDRGRADLHADGGKIDQDRGSITGYLTQTFADNGFVYGSLTGGYSSYKTERTTAIGKDTGDTDGYDFGLAAGVGYTIKLPESFDITPYVGISYTSNHTKGFTETGDALAVTMEDHNYESLRGRIGGDFGWAFPVGTGKIRLSLGAAYEYEFLDDDVAMHGAFVNGTGSFGVRGDTLSKDNIVITPAISWLFAPTQSVSAGYSYEYGFEGTESHRFDVAYTVRF